MKLNISIDDVSPHPLSSIKVLDRCFDLIKEFSEIKFSLFVPASYWRTIKSGTTTNEALTLDLYPEFCSHIKNLPRKNFEICYHGLFHGIPNLSDNDEFKNLDYEQAIEKFTKMFQIISNANLTEIFQPVFRPPAWRMSASAIRAAKDLGIKILALSSKDYAKNTYAGAEKDFNKVVYYNCNPPFDKLEFFSPYTEVVYHACEWDSNYFSEEKTEELKVFINSQNNIEFCFMDKLL
jgi:predicted deacetylase